MAFQDTLDAEQMRSESRGYRPAPEDYTADSGVRLANFFIDYAVRFGYIFVLMGFEKIYQNYLSVEDASALLGFMMLFGLFLYYPLTEYFYGKSVGKMLTRTSVVSVTGEKPSFLQILGRTLCRLIPFEALSFFSDRAVGWHDSFSDTRVVKDRYWKDYQSYFGEEF